LRLWAIQTAVAGAVLADPDGYVGFARMLSDGVRPWRWTVDAVSYGEYFKAPLYQVALSILTANGLAIVTWGLTAHAVLNTASIAWVYVIGRALHTTRAGLLAAAMYALWVPNIRLTATFWQEHLFVPLLLLGFAVLALAVERPARMKLWLAAGAAFGAAALTRSSVIYYLPLAGAWLWFKLPTHRRGVAGFLAAVLVITLPYVIALSRDVRRFVPIEDIGSFSLRAHHPVSPADASITMDHFAPNKAVAPTGVETVRFLAADFGAAPLGFVARRIGMARMLLKPAGGSAIESTVVPSREAANWVKLRSHLTLDLPFVLVLLLFPLGFALSRQRVVAGLLLIWILQVTILLALTMWAGVRFRAPIEPAAIVLASVVVAGGWVWPRRTALLVAFAVFAGVTASLVENAAPIVRARASYGVDAWPIEPGQVATFKGAAGLRSVLVGDEIHLRVEARDAADTQLTVRMHGRVIDVVPLPSGQSRLMTYRNAAADGSYIELDARTATGGPATDAVGVR
jgi:hypothetical protein